MAAIPHRQLDHHHHRHQQQQQSKPLRNHGGVDGQITTPIPFFYPSAAPEQSHPSFVHVMGLAPGPVADGGGSSGWEPRQKRLKEQEFMETSPQISSLDFLRAAPPVSTGLGLSLDDRHVLGTSSSSGNSPLPPLGDEMSRVVLRLDAEMDHFVKMQGARLRNEILEQVHVKQFQALLSVEERVRRKIQEKEAEVEDINKKNTELEEQMKQASMEVAAWQQRAKYNENLIAALKHNLQQVHVQGRGSKEGCGDSEVDDTASCCNGGATNFQLAWNENKGAEDLLTCKVCKVNEVCMLLLPCRHLCLCKDCEGKLSFCPLCQSSKFIGMEIYM